MILINGCAAGIGTGWSCNVPCFNPIDVINSIRIWIENDGEVFLTDPDTNEKCCVLPDLVPWYRGFKGSISECGDKKYKTDGIVDKGDRKNTTIVTELPIGLWTNKFKETCEDLVVSKKLKGMKNYSTTQDVNFVLSESLDGLSCNLKNLKLSTYVYTSNMVMFNESNHLKKYDSPQEIIDNFCKVRLKYYMLRKEYQISDLQKQLDVLKNKERFIKEVIEDTLVIIRRDEKEISTELEDKNYDKDPQDNTYNYLLRLPIRTLTSNKLTELDKDISSLTTQLTKLKKTKPETIWIGELLEFEHAYTRWLTNMASRVPKKSKKKA